ncbi:MAG: ABC-F family ATP-binding cassette domain-containing protein [Bacteroidales bacterium]|nr:ABC-F family ATP-binding cassette domain-containing protein [Bacteroidales bacterium]
MASWLQIEGISKSYGLKVLFEKISFNVNEGDKIALIAPNGTGKTSLLRIIAGKDKSDYGGRVTFVKDIRIAFLEQEYDFDPEKGIYDQILAGSGPFIADLPEEAVSEFQRRVTALLTSFGFTDFSKKMSLLSGGEVKRVALTQMLATDADFYIMDEPTNHLDIDAIEYLENFLSHSRCTLLMVTHDRYFLDHVCNTVMELDHGNIYTYKGDYQNFLEKRAERIENYNAETDRVKNILRRELEWMHASPCARTGKAKYRKDAFYSLKDRAGQVYRTQQISLDSVGGASRLGSKIINCKNLSYYCDGACYLDSFTYNFQRYERVGIVGGNGVGKTTFIDILTGNIPEDQLSGQIERGQSLKIGYYKQSGMEFEEGQTVLETVPDTALLGQFMFPHDMLNNKISSLSGGEKRRLYLLTILSRKPNLLILDEPTNDLDIVTLNILEEYLKDFKGSLIIVSHDRHFLDRLVDHLFILTGEGVIKDFIGDYSQYRQYMLDYNAARRAEQRAAEKSARQAALDSAPAQPQPRSKKLSYKEQREFQALEAEIPELEAEKAELESLLAGGTTDYQQIEKASARYKEVAAALDEKELRWLELAEAAK